MSPNKHMRLWNTILDWCAEPLFADPPIAGAGYSGPTGNWYIEHHQRPGSVTTHLSGHLTRWGAEREVALCKKFLPWAGEGQWVVKPTSEYGRSPGG